MAASPLRLAALVALPLLGLAACARAPEPAAPAPAPVVVSTAKEAVGVVERVNARTREVTIRTPGEGRIVVVAGPEVRNFNQIRRGNNVRLRYEEAVAVRMAPRGTQMPAETAVGAARAEAGSQPGAAVVRTTRARVTVNAVDTAANTVTFTGPNRVRRTVAVRSPEMQAFIRTLRPGSQVDVAIAEATALSVEPAER